MAYQSSSVGVGVGDGVTDGVGEGVTLGVTVEDGVGVTAALARVHKLLSQ